VVVANLTKVAGNWQALFNDELWKNNSLIGSVYHAALRTMVEDLAIKPGRQASTASSRSRACPSRLTAFSQRREDVLAKAAEVGITTPQGRDALVIRTRDAKVNLEDRDGLRAEWGSGSGAGV
jgi:conjugative relaxase-like TrwC/TraI family protein